MKKAVCLILVIAFCSAARAQTQAPRWSFDVSGGAAYPIGQFAHTEEQNPVSGTVHTGSIFEGSATYHLNRTWGITLLAGSQHHNSDLDRTYLPFGLPVNPTPEMLAIYDPQHWSMTRILAGGVYTFPLNQKRTLALLVRALAGIEKTHTSEYSYAVDYQDWNGFSILPARNLPWALSYQADAGLRWKPYRHWSLLAFAGYNGCRPSYNQDIDVLVAPNGLSVPDPTPTYKKIYFSTGSILLRAGVGFDL